MQPATAQSILKLDMELDSQQKKAVDNPTIPMAISAGAGSGKTRVLVERYIKVIIDGLAETEEILAITFTIKAAAELKLRIRERLNEIQFEKPETDEGLNAQKALLTIESAPISTIHSFCQSILKKYAIEAEIEPDFQILESNESSLVYKEIIQRVTAQFLRTNNEKEKKLIHTLGLNDLRSIAENMLNDRYKFSNAVNSTLFLHRNGKFEETIENMLEDELSILLNSVEMKSSIDDLKKCIPLDKSDAMAMIRENVLDLFDEISAQKSNREKLSKLLELGNSIDLRGGRKTSWDEGEKDRVKSSLKTIRAVIDDLFGGEKELNFMNNETAEKLLEGLELYMSRLFKEYDYTMSSLGVLDYDGLLFRAMNLLSERKDIAGFYRQQFKQILVDEFQDTDDLQMDIIKILTTEDENVPVLFLVGDENQSIYKFRGAEVSNFQKMIETTGIKGPLYITKNYRSQPDMIKFFNSFFSSFLGDTDNGYEVSQTFREKLGDTPNVQFLLPIANNGEGVSNRELEADLMARQLLLFVGSESISDGEGGERILKFSDIGILFQKMTSVAEYLDKFEQLGIPYYMRTRSGFYDRLEILDLLNFFRAIEKPKDDYVHAAWLRSPIVGLSDNALFLIGTGVGFSASLSSEIGDNYSQEDQERLSRAGELMFKYRKLKDRMGVSDFVQKIVDEIAYIPFLLSTENGTQKALNIYKLLDKIASFEKTGVKTFGDLVEQMDTIQSGNVKEGQAQASSEEDDVVTITTVHGSKGLQFPVVFLPDLEASFPHSPDNFKYDSKKGIGFRISKQQSTEYDPLFWLLRAQDKRKNLAERRRLFYVAMTRAKDHLFFVGARESKKEGLKSPKKRTWLEYLFETVGVENSEDSTTVEFADLNFPIIIDLPEVEPYRPSSEEKGNSKVIEYSEDFIAPIKKESKPVSITPTKLLKYLECSWKYALEELHGIEEPELEIKKDDLKDLAATGKLFGRVAHKFFAKMDYQASNDDSLINEVISEEGVRGNKAEEFRTKLQDIAARFRETELFKEVLSLDGSDVKREEDVFIEFQSVLIEGTIDLICNSEGKRTLIDYKTDDITQNDIETKIERYKPQLMLYAKAVKNITGDYPERTLLYFTKTNEFKEISVSDESILQVEKHLLDLLEDYKENDFKKNADACNSCGYYKEYCDGV